MCLIGSERVLPSSIMSLKVPTCCASKAEMRKLDSKASVMLWHFSDLRHFYSVFTAKFCTLIWLKVCTSEAWIARLAVVKASYLNAFYNCKMSGSAGFVIYICRIPAGHELNLEAPVS